jgi:hypothetical protein
MLRCLNAGSLVLNISEPILIIASQNLSWLVKTNNEFFWLVYI